MPDHFECYLTLAAAGTAARTHERSTFLATAAPAEDEAATRTVVEQLRRRYHDARHICSAWRLGYGSACRESRHDDGEPSGTAGEPILQAIRAAGVSDAVVAVVRYFGGVKLGMGGLARAYGGTAAAALDAAPRRRILLGRCFAVEFPYAQQKSLTHHLARHGGRILASDYGQTVRWHIWLPEEGRKSFARCLGEQTAGRTVLQPLAGDQTPAPAPAADPPA